MTRRYITLPNGRKCGLGTYARAWAALKRADPAALFPGFAYFPERAESILHAMRGGLSERINRHVTGYGIGRKWDNDYQVRLWRDSRRLRDIAARIIVRQFETVEARSRFAHLLTDWRDAA